MRFGILHDMQKTGGSGTINDGNKARRAFKKPNLFSKITEVDLELINRIRVILILINSNFKIYTD